ncbi:hypothetical protein BU24DRAFT_417149 [Aaosphaeria arxii CBS 175.79]|uniref:Zn(2)-C6 fungal-type domain-containing protein n=1 Tax=Aaosphaeria arxii CBS 175.79 TaxID=1450172 RepID=A0A6A5Y7K2_9PLEO|nr:uncharacterized protein BU24DRAFT_417149 [Aaosphaeria arxii CBS 175.79]KAF2021508.1 hypothetical protein BU24DRAFT_417149 [Aaosphaeria arxii CBS 175.79]
MSTEMPHRVVPPSRRRDKPILSCNLCRRRKLKCDRQQPCKTCVDRGLSLSCTYTRNVPPAHEPKPHNVHDRIDQLEKLVTSLMSAKSANGDDPMKATEHRSNHDSYPISGSSTHTPYEQSPSADSTEPEVAGVHETMKLDQEGTRYQNSSHWSSILDGISELREQLDQIPTTPRPQNPVLSEIPGPDLFFGQQRHASRNEILAAIPPKAECDVLLETYFASMELAPNLIHRQTFEREYAEFWERPTEMPPMWLALLFTVFVLAVRFQWVLDASGMQVHELADAPVRSVRMDFYREKVVQCLILGNYGKCPPYTIEALLQYFVTEYFRSQDSQFGTWMLVGVIVRVAFRMGYHRDPSRFSNISVFKAEMRRRIWVMILQVDLMSSSQMGLPRMIQSNMHDVMEPRNLEEDDLYEGMEVLPPSRPVTESTPMLHALLRNKLLQVFSRILDLTSLSSQPSYQDIIETDASLHAVYEDMPSSMKPFRFHDANPEDPDIAKRRRFLGLNFLKATLMLHRPYHLAGRTDPKYARSRMLCVDSALEILELQQLIDREAKQSTDRLWKSKWHLWTISWRLSAIVNQDFLLATTILSLDLDTDIANPMPDPDPNSPPRQRFKTGQPSRAEVIDALKGAYSIWLRSSATSREAQRVAAAVRLVLGKAGTSVEPDPNLVDYGTPISQFDFNNFATQSTSNYNQPTEPNTSFYGWENANFNPPLFDGDIDIHGFDWRGLEMDFTPFENKSQVFGPPLERQM